MNRKSLWLTLVILLTLAGGTATALALLVRHEPTFYRRCAVLPGAERKRLSAKFFSAFMSFYDSARFERSWGATFTQDQINCYLEEDFLRSGLLEKNLPDRVRSLRVNFENDRVRVGFRYGSGDWSTVVSIDLRLWLVPAEPNVVAVELCGLHAGVLPVSAQSLLEGVAEAARQNHMEMTWYRHEGHPVALLRVQTDRTHPTVQLQRLALRPGQIELAGRAIELAPGNAAPAAPVGKPAS